MTRERAPHRTAAAMAAVALALLATLLAPGQAEARFEAQVLNGEEASITDLPAVVYLEAGESACTGSLIHSQWVLTAGHCFEGDIAPSEVTVFIGYDDLSETADLDVGVYITASELVLHPDWDDASQTGTDVALAKLPTPVTTTVLPLVAAGTVDPVGTTATVAGWGSTTIDADGNDTGGGDRLLRADVPVLDDSTCASLYGDDSYANYEQYVCAGGGDSDVCQGDSGGPIMIEQDGRFVLIGATAWGSSCEVATGTVGAYTSVAFVRGWIDQTIGASSTPDDGGNDDGGDAGSDGPFDDVPADHPHAEGVTWVSDEGITSGCGGRNFCPTTKVSRAQMATFLATALGLTASGDPEFDDVPADHTHAAGIAAVAEAGITGGCGDGNFCPTTKVSRAQMATFLKNTLDQ